MTLMVAEKGPAPAASDAATAKAYLVPFARPVPVYVVAAIVATGAASQTPFAARMFRSSSPRTDSRRMSWGGA